MGSGELQNHAHKTFKFIDAEKRAAADFAEIEKKRTKIQWASMRARGLSVISDFISIFPSLSLPSRPTLTEKLSIVSKTSKDEEKVISDNTNKQLHRVDSRDEVRIEERKKHYFVALLLIFLPLRFYILAEDLLVKIYEKNSDCSKRAHSMWILVVCPEKFENIL